MAGRGPAPKPPGTRARRNADPVHLRVVTVEPTKQPGLPEVWRNEVVIDSETGEETLKRRKMTWPPQTIAWWQMWDESPLSNEFTDSDWTYLLDTALLHAAFWSGNMKAAAELRQRVAKFGATPEDRARLRIQFAVADESERKAEEGRKRPAAKRTTSRKKTTDPRLALASG